MKRMILGILYIFIDTNDTLHHRVERGFPSYSMEQLHYTSSDFTLQSTVFNLPSLGLTGWLVFFWSMVDWFDFDLF